MKGLKKKRRIQIIALAVVALALSTALIGYAMRDGINFFLSPSQIAAEPPPPNQTFRIGGLVEVGTLVRGQGETIRFMVTDGGASDPRCLHRRAARSVRRERGHGRHRPPDRRHLCRPRNPGPP
jgi:hypothetical protein